ncbi:MAG: DUF3465 domain-containing protein [Bdellovibrionales bacterium]|nr:DUF3465 domain-containing protein [Bdellovibrionales bacterium]
MESGLRLRSRVHLVSIFLFLFTTATALASPACLNFLGEEIQLNNEQVLNWKKVTPNQYLDRAKVKGVVQDIYPARKTHYHFQIKIGPKEKDTLELIYNISFGAIDRIVPGMNVVACGDYITSNAPTEVYQPSPDGAIIHWLHRSPRPNRHPHGYLELDGVVYGD